tara:strand:- start:45022 stop:45162 length:141 start_codon:yes stop_codon:yes gene_type:complete
MKNEVQYLVDFMNFLEDGGVDLDLRFTKPDTAIKFIDNQEKTPRLT